MRHHDVACLKMRQVAYGNDASYLVEAEMVRGAFAAKFDRAEYFDGGRIIEN
jgi:hypothetical protein